MPDARLYLEGRNPGPIQVEGARGLLSSQKTAAILAELLLEKKAQGVQVNLIYDSVDSIISLAKQVAGQFVAHDALGAHARDELGICLSSNPKWRHDLGEPHR